MFDVNFYLDGFSYDPGEWCEMPDPEELATVMYWKGEFDEDTDVDYLLSDWDLYYKLYFNDIPF